MSAAAHARSKGPSRDPQLKTLLIRPGAIGDLIVSLPALEFCRTDYTEVWVAPQNVPLIRFADQVRSIPSTGLDLLELGLDNRAHERMRGFDRIISWYGTTRPEFRAAVSDLPVTFFPALPSNCHATDFYMRQVGGPDGAVPTFHLPRSPRGFIAIHPYSGSPSKNWPIENYLALAGALPGAEFCELNGERKLDNLWDLAMWLATARAYVGNDSGITHLAAAVGLPVIAIFRNTDPNIWAPRGDVRVLIEPSVDEVLFVLRLIVG